MDAAGQPYVVVAVPLGTTGYALVVARPLGVINGVLSSERLILLCVILASILGAAVLSGFVAQSSLRPVRQLTAAVEHVTDTRDFQPVAIRYVRGDLAVLAAAFNQLLRTIGRMRERQARLMADAGHELRTPLTSLTTNVELLHADLSSDRLSAAQKGAILGDVRAQLAELSDLVGDLVHLARDDSAGTFRPLDVRDAVGTAVERVRRRGGDRVFDVELGELYLVGDPDGSRADDDQPAGQRGQVEPAREHDPGPSPGEPAAGVRLGPGHPGGRPAVRVRPLLPGRDRPQHPGHRAGALDRGQDRGGPRGHGLGRTLVGRRRRVRRAAARGHEPRGAAEPPGPVRLTGAQVLGPVTGGPDRDLTGHSNLGMLGRRDGAGRRRRSEGRSVKTLELLWKHPMQRRVSLLTTVAVALAVVLCSLVGYLALRSTVVGASEGVAAAIAADLAAPAADELRTDGALGADLRQPGGVVVEAVDASGRVSRVPGEPLRLVLEARDLAVARADATSVQRVGRSTDGQRFAVVSVPVPGTGRALVVARPLAPALEILRAQRLVLLAISVAGVLAAAVAGLVVGLTGLRPMRQLTDAVEHVTATQDYQPVAAPYATGDLMTLAASFNLLLRLPDPDARAAVPPRRRRRPRAAHPAHEHAHERRPAAVRRAPRQADAGGEGGRPERPRRPARRAQRADRRPRPRGPRRHRAGARPRSTSATSWSRPSSGSGAGRPA